MGDYAWMVWAVCCVSFLLLLLVQSTMKRKNKPKNEITYTYLYHGSKTKINDKLEPKPSGVLEGESAVFAVCDRVWAALFIGEWLDSDLSVSLYDGKRVIREYYSNAFDLLKKQGFIYRVKSDGFKSDVRLGLNGIEFISKKPKKIEETEHVPNAYEILSSDKDTVLLHFRHVVNFSWFGNRVQDYADFVILYNYESRKQVKKGVFFDLRIFFRSATRVNCVTNL
jgi:hypothetical protein